jgi:Ca2+-binding EF-hand superfamily protein
MSGLKNARWGVMRPPPPIGRRLSNHEMRKAADQRPPEIPPPPSQEGPVSQLFVSTVDSPVFTPGSIRSTTGVVSRSRSPSLLQGSRTPAGWTQGPKPPAPPDLFTQSLPNAARPAWDQNFASSSADAELRSPAKTRVIKNPRHVEWRRQNDERRLDWRHQVASSDTLRSEATASRNDNSRYIAVSTPVAKSVRAVPREAKDLLRLGLASSLERLAERFRARDGAQSGEIGFDEFRLSLAQLGLFAKLATFGHSLAVAEAAAETLFGEFDGDGSGVISCEEFLRYALRDALRQSLTRVIDLFRQLDSDRDGKIGLAEFGKVLKAAGVVAPEDVVERLFAQMDLDGDGAIDPKELHRVLRSEDVKLEGVMYV